MLQPLRRHAPAIMLVVVVVLVAVLRFSALGWWAYLLLLAAFLTASAIAANLKRREAAALSEAERLAEVQAELQEQQSQLELREQNLANRLAVYHEWMEFPQPVDLAAGPSEDELSDFAEKDRKLHELLTEASEQFFNHIRENKYAPEGQFSLALVRDDAKTLAEKVARIYQPELESDHPLLNTNIENILRSSSRLCLQLLTLLDQLPVNVKQQSIDSLYTHVRRAVAAYGVYRKAQPYFTYVNSAYLLGRLAMGANPVSLGALWIAGQVGKHATQNLTSRFVNRQALSLLHQTIRVLGYEVANMYGAGFRYRDANWIYGAELTELLVCLPVNHRCLNQALQDVGSLTLRSEFDRIFLYRCIAQGAGARPEQYRAHVVLTPSERQAVANRLERFADAFSGGASPSKLRKWKTGAEARLDVRLKLNAKGEERNPDTPLDATRALMGFLVEIKQFEPAEAWEAVLETSAFENLSSAHRADLEERWKDNPAYFFELPDLVPDSKEAIEFFGELTDLAVRHAPRGPGNAQMLENVSAFLRISEEKARAALALACQKVLEEKVTSVTDVEADAALPLLDVLVDIPSATFLYGGVHAKWSEPPEEASAWDELYLLGEPHQMSLLALRDDGVEVVWRAAKGEATLEKGGYLFKAYALTGGEWLTEGATPDQLTLRGKQFSLKSNDQLRELFD